MNSRNVLLIASDSGPGEAVKGILQGLGLIVTRAATGSKGLQLAGDCAWGLVVVAFDLPDMCGFDVCRELRQNSNTVSAPIVVVSNCSNETDIVATLELGADDFIAEPISPRVFGSRIRSLMRQRTQAGPSRRQIIEIQGLKIAPDHREVRVGDERIRLTATEFELLHLLARYSGQALRREEILKNLRGEHRVPSARSVDVLVVGLRRRLGAFGQRIETIRGIGYRLSVL